MPILKLILGIVASFIWKTCKINEIFLVVIEISRPSGQGLQDQLVLNNQKTIACRLPHSFGVHVTNDKAWLVCMEFPRMEFLVYRITKEWKFLCKEFSITEMLLRVSLFWLSTLSLGVWVEIAFLRFTCTPCLSRKQYNNCYFEATKTVQFNENI